MDVATDPLEPRSFGGQPVDRIPAPRSFLAEVATEACDGNPAKPNAALAGGVRPSRGLHRRGMASAVWRTLRRAGRPRSETRPTTGGGICAIVELDTHADPDWSRRGGTQLISGRGARRSDRQGLFPGVGYSANARCETSSSHELLPQADSERQAAEEDQRDGRDLRQHRGRAGEVRGDPETLEISMDTRPRSTWAITLGGRKSDRCRR